MNQAAVTRLAERAQHLTAVKNSPSWPVVKAILEEQIEKAFSQLVGNATLSNEQLHYGRGRVQGMRVMLLMVEAGEKEYQKAMKAAQALEGAEEA